MELTLSVQTHPNINRQAFAEQNMLVPKDPQRPFPVNSSLGVLKWHVQAQDERLLPFSGVLMLMVYFVCLPCSVTCWPSEQDTGAVVTLEYEGAQGFALENVVITVPMQYVPHPVCIWILFIVPCAGEQPALRWCQRKPAHIGLTTARSC